MTAEIAIMNKEAIALAADSAVTLSSPDGQKIFTSANKLFALSKYHPVGIMIYGKASLMDIPWETIIKIFRKKLNKNSFNSLLEYADSFIEFVNKKNPLFPIDEQKKYFSQILFSYFSIIQKDIIDEMQKSIKSNGGIDDTKIYEIVNIHIQKYYDYLLNKNVLEKFPKNYAVQTVKKYNQEITNIINKVFEKLIIDKKQIDLLFQISKELLIRDIFHSNISGLVIAGFGENDTFPVLRYYDIEGIINNKLKYKKNNDMIINFKNRAAVLPFAQREMVHTFMEGIEPNLLNWIDGYLNEIFLSFPKMIIENISNLSEDYKKQLLEKLLLTSKKICDNWDENIKNIRQMNFVDPVIKVVAMLPKNELATMAETFINLTSFKRKVTMESETVGGPIDVAVISKGDGFIWIKRKHYFDKDFNPQFFSNYYRGEDNNEKK